MKILVLSDNHFTDLSKIKVRLVDKFESYGTNIIVK